MEKISTGHFLDTFGAFWMFSSCMKNPKKLHVKGSSLKGFTVSDCSHQTNDILLPHFPKSPSLAVSLQKVALLH
jgi:hypothetical protein